jgi:S-formylglutathione hydrolase
MGGHGALTLGLKYAKRFKSISAFSPIVNPMNCPWGKKAFRGYLGEDLESWACYDSCELIKAGYTHQTPILISQGTADGFLEEQLKTDALVKACRGTKQVLEVHYATGYDHSYYFVSSFIEKHLRFHANFLIEND